MISIILLSFAVALSQAGPAPKAALLEVPSAQIVSAPLITSPVITAQSSQFLSRNYNGFAAPIISNQYITTPLGSSIVPTSFASNTLIANSFAAPNSNLLPERLITVNPFASNLAEASIINSPERLTEGESSKQNENSSELKENEERKDSTRKEENSSLKTNEENSDLKNNEGKLVSKQNEGNSDLKQNEENLDLKKNEDSLKKNEETSNVKNNKEDLNLKKDGKFEIETLNESNSQEESNFGDIRNAPSMSVVVANAKLKDIKVSSAPLRVQRVTAFPQKLRQPTRENNQRTAFVLASASSPLVASSRIVAPPSIIASSSLIPSSPLVSSSPVVSSPLLASSPFVASPLISIKPRPFISAYVTSPGVRSSYVSTVPNVYKVL